MRRRWDLVLLGLLLGGPIVACGTFAIASLGMDDIVDQASAWAIDLRKALPRGAAAADLAPLQALAAQPLSAPARAEIDGVLAGVNAPWQVSPETTAALRSRELLVAALSLDATLDANHSLWRPLTAQELTAVADVGRDLGYSAVHTRSRGLGALADAHCLHGYAFALALARGGAVDDHAAADGVFRTLNGVCREDLGTQDRDARLDMIGAVLELARGAPHIVDTLKRERVWRTLIMLRRTAGPLPERLVRELPPHWTLDPEDTLNERLLNRAIGRLAIRSVTAATTEAIARELTVPRGPPVALAPPFDTQTALPQNIIGLRAADELWRATFRLLLARLVAEVFVIDHARWPSTAADLHLADAELDDRVQHALQPTSLDFVTHGEYLSIILDGHLNIRATLPDSLAGLAEEPLPARDFTGRLLESPTRSGAQEERARSRPTR